MPLKHLPFFRYTCERIRVFAKTNLGKILLIIILFALLARVGMSFHLYNTPNDDYAGREVVVENKNIHLDTVLTKAIENAGELIDSDSRAYLYIAHGMLELGKYSSIKYDPQFPEVFRMPGYPTFLLSIYLLIGDNGFFIAASIVQAFLSVLTILLAFYIASRVWNKKVGVGVALLMAIDFYFVYYSALLLSETLFIFLFVSTIFFVERFFKYEKNIDAFLIGLIIVISAFVRSLGLFLIVPILVLIVVHLAFKRTSLKKIAIIVALMILPWALMTNAWKYRNLNATGSYEFSSGSGYTLYMLKASSILAYNEGLPLVPFWVKYPNYYDDIYPEDWDTYSEFEQEEYHKQLAKPIIFDNLGPFFILSTRDILFTMFLPGEPLFSVASIERGNREGHTDYYTFENITHYAKIYPERFVVSFAYFLLLLFIYITAVYGWVVNFLKDKKLRFFHILMLGLISYFIFIYYFFARGVPRYRISMMPIFMLYSASGLYYFFVYLLSKSKKREGDGLLSNWLRNKRTGVVSGYIKGNVLDIGCGPANLLDLNKDKIDVYYGIEYDDEMLRKLRHEYPKMKFYKKNLDEDEFGFEHKFDTVVMLAVIEHIYNQKHLMNQIVRNLKDGGRVVLTTPTPFGNDIIHRIGSAIGIFNKGGGTDDHIVIYNKKRFGILAKDFDLSIEKYKRFQLGCNQLVVLRKKD